MITQCIRDLDEATTFLKATINTLPAVARLPPELLWRVIGFCVLPGHPGADPPEHTRRLLAYARVSRHWRAAVYGCPRVWSHLTFASAAWTRTLLKRSSVTPLTVHADLRDWTADSEDAVAAALEHLRRVRSVDVLAPPQRMENLLAQMARDAPVLESLALANHSVHLQMLPGTLFNGSAPLRTLKLVDFVLDWSLPLFVRRDELGMMRLTTLDISKSFASRHGRPTIEQLLDTLQCMPNLETLRLWRMLPVGTDSADAFAPPQPERTVHLPDLTCLSLADNVTNCAWTLAHLRVPPTTAVHIECLACDATDEDFTALLAALAAHLRGAAPAPALRGVRLSQDLGRCLLLEAWAAEGAEEPAPAERVLGVRMMWRHWDEARAGRVAARACAALPLARVRYACVDGVPMGERAWRAVLEAVPRTSTVCVRRHGVDSLVAALAPTEAGAEDVEGREGVGAAVTVVPRLRYLKVRDVHFGQTDFLPALAQCILRRRVSQHKSDTLVAGGAQLETVVLDRCRVIGEDGVAALEELGVEVSVVCASPQ